MADGHIDVSKFVQHLNTIIKRDRKDILTRIYVEDDEIIKACYPVNGIKIGNLRTRTIGSITEVAQPYVKPVFTHKGDISLVPSTFVQFGHKVNVALFPHDLIGTYPGEDFYEEDKSPMYQKFVWWALDNLVFNQLKEDHVLIQLYKGRYVNHAGQPNVAHPAADSMNGILYFLENGDYHQEHFANVMTAIGQLSTDPETIYQQLNDAAKLLPEKYRFTKAIDLFLSPSLIQLYWEGREKKIGTHVNTDDKDRNKIPNTNITMKGSNAMIGTRDFFMTFPGNMFRMTDKTGLINSLRTKEEIYSVNLAGEYALGYGFDYMELVWTNVPKGGWGSGSGSGS